MANQILGSVYIIDASSANVAFPWLANSYVEGIAFWGADTTSVVQFTFANTSNVWLRLDNPNQFEATQYVHFGGVRIDELKVPTLTAGTAWIYLK